MIYANLRKMVGVGGETTNRFPLPVVTTNRFSLQVVTPNIFSFLVVVDGELIRTLRYESDVEFFEVFSLCSIGKKMEILPNVLNNDFSRHIGSALVDTTGITFSAKEDYVLLLECRYDEDVVIFSARFETLKRYRLE